MWNIKKIKITRWIINEYKKITNNGWNNYILKDNK